MRNATTCWKPYSKTRPKYLELRKKPDDGMYGGTTYVENWVGWEGTDGAFVIDLGAPTAIHSIATDFLRQLGAWILMPMQVRYSVSPDGENYTEIATIDIPEDRGSKVEFIPVTATATSQPGTSKWKSPAPRPARNGIMVSATPVGSLSTR